MSAVVNRALKKKKNNNYSFIPFYRHWATIQWYRSQELLSTHVPNATTGNCVECLLETLKTTLESTLFVSNKPLTETFRKNSSPPFIPGNPYTEDPR